MKLILSIDFQKNMQISNFKKLRPAGTELFSADGQTDRQDEANRPISKFWGSA